MNLHHASEPLSKINHISDMSRISMKGLNHYTVVYGLNYRRFKYCVAGHSSMQWTMMEDCFRDICNSGAGYERAKGYCRVEFNTPETSTITEVKTMRKPGPCYNCGGPHFQGNCTDLKGNNSNKFQNKATTWQNYKGNNYTQKFYSNNNNSNIFPMGTLSFQASQ